MELHPHEKLIIGCFRDLDGKVRLQDLCKRVVRKQFPAIGKSQPKTAGHYTTTKVFLLMLIDKKLVKEYPGELYALTTAGRVLEL